MAGTLRDAMWAHLKGLMILYPSGTEVTIAIRLKGSACADYVLSTEATTDQHALFQLLAGTEAIGRRSVG
ncbi:hypothetical protein [Mesorhizobium huakuii]|uniref:Uncharacterized protein n=1 Tax=Mesorhizobium huakuii TaxID=28104 RepID=A0A7G6SL59_9HYPH|nr:hypothetical protein [Mesorhizobium huakuii]QND55241.1 hypothetical protein HB778_30605 [Mesorhizobium huakuii]